MTFVDKINVPTFLVCQWQDEQTGGHCPELVSQVHRDGQEVVHVHERRPHRLTRPGDLQPLVRLPPAVRRRARHRSSSKRPPARRLRSIYQLAMGLPQDSVVTLPPDPIQAMPTYDLALAAFEDLPMIRVLFENGAGTSPTGQQDPGQSLPGLRALLRLVADPGHRRPDLVLRSRTARCPTSFRRPRASTSYTSDANALPLTNYAGGTGGGGLWGNASQWDWNWEQNPDGHGRLVRLGASADRHHRRRRRRRLRLGASRRPPTSTSRQRSARSVPTGTRRSCRTATCARASASSRPIPTTCSSARARCSTRSRASSRPTPRRCRPTASTKVAIPLYYQGHVYRAGSRIRVTIAGPNGAQPVWSFSESVPDGTSDVSIAFSPSQPSKLVLPVIPGVQAPTELPPCPSLRNQPCRPYQPIVNRAAL